MREARAWAGLLRHTLNLARTGQLRFRLETFGVYYPSLPYRSRLWKVTPRGAVLLLSRARHYAHWLLEMQDLRRGRRWWDTKR